jgi:hypothetical protein
MLSVGVGLALAHAAASASNACEFLLRCRGLTSGSTRASMMRSFVSGRSIEIHGQRSDIQLKKPELWCVRPLIDRMILPPALEKSRN